MSHKKTDQAPAFPTPPPLPSYITNAALMRRKRVTRRTMPSYTEGMLMLFTPQILPVFFQKLHEQVAAGDKEAMKMVAEIWKYAQKSGISVTQNILNANGAAAPGRITMDQIVRTLEENPSKTVNLLPAP